MTQKDRMWSKLKQRLNSKKNKEPEVDYTCKNCGTQFTGHYCPNCGQAVRDYDKPFSFIFYNFLGDFFAFDTRFFRTLGSLIVRPGFLTKEYFEGRRVRYAPPFRVYIFVSFVLFLLLQIVSNRGLTTVLDSDFKGKGATLDSTSMVVADSIMQSVDAELDPGQVALKDSVLKQTGFLDSAGNAHFDFNLDSTSVKGAKDLRHALSKYAVSLEKELETETDPEERAKLREYIRLCRSPESAVAEILENISWAFFFLLPIFALLLKLIYIRRKQNYMRHLVFSIHTHSFIFIVLTFIIAMYLGFNAKIGGIVSISILLVPVYLIIAMKKFYGQSIVKVILKFFVVSFLYNIVFFVVVTYATLYAINIL